MGLCIARQVTSRMNLTGSNSSSTVTKPPGGNIMKTIIYLTALILIPTLAGCDQEAALVTSPDTLPGVEAAKAADDEHDCGCTDIEATLFSVVDFATFTAEGTIVGDLEGAISFTGDPTSVTPVSGDNFPPLDPTTSAFTSRLVITTEAGTLTTRGVGIAEFSPPGVGAEFHRIIGGTGTFVGSTGTLYFNVEGDASGQRFTEAVTGQICTPCDDDGDDDDDDD